MSFIVVIFEFRGEMPGFFSAAIALLSDQPAPIPDGAPSRVRVLIPSQGTDITRRDRAFMS